MTHLNGLLPDLFLLPPPREAGWTGTPLAKPQMRPLSANTPASDGVWPLFWYDPPWHTATPTAALAVAQSVAQLQIAVSALASELSLEDADGATLGPNRIIPYRPDRYGLQLADLQAASVIDIRLVPSRDAAGRFAYSPRQMQRWLGTATTAGDAPWMPAPDWLPELQRIGDLSRKFEQLRRLAPQAACFVSIGPTRLAEELPQLLSSEPDGVILRLDDFGALDGRQVALLVCQARQLMRRAGKDDHMPLWLVPPVDPTPDDCVKLMALGASAIAIDAWCNPLLSPPQGSRSMAAGGAALRPSAGPDPTEQFGADLDRIAGLISSCGAHAADELSGAHLTTADQGLATQLGIGWLLREPADRV